MTGSKSFRLPVGQIRPFRLARRDQAIRKSENRTEDLASVKSESHSVHPEIGLQSRIKRSWFRYQGYKYFYKSVVNTKGRMKRWKPSLKRVSASHWRHFEYSLSVVLNISIKQNNTQFGDQYSVIILLKYRF